MSDLATCTTAALTRVELAVKVGSTSGLVLLSRESSFLVLLDLFERFHETTVGCQ